MAFASPCAIQTFQTFDTRLYFRLIFAYNWVAVIGLNEVTSPEKLAPRQRLLVVCAAMVAAVRTRDLQPLNTVTYHKAIEDSVTIAEEVLRTCFRRFPEIFR
jgi:hypothetical protein